MANASESMGRWGIALVACALGTRQTLYCHNKKRSKLNAHVVNVSIVQRAFGALSKLRRIRPLPKTVLVLHGATVAGLWLDGRYQQQQRRKHKVNQLNKTYQFNILINLIITFSIKP